MIPVKGHSDLFRDEESGAIVNTDHSQYNNYIEMKNRKKSEKEELDRMKPDIEEIKTLLKQLVNPTWV